MSSHHRRPYHHMRRGRDACEGAETFSLYLSTSSPRQQQHPIAGHFIHIDLTVKKIFLLRVWSFHEMIYGRVTKTDRAYSACARLNLGKFEKPILGEEDSMNSEA